MGRLKWEGTRNGKLVGTIEIVGFDVFITNDKRMEHEQNLARRPFAVLLLSTNHWLTLEPHSEKVAQALDGCELGTAMRVECRRFVPGKVRVPRVGPM